MHNAILQLDVCNVGTHNSYNMTGHLNIWFPILADQNETEKYITLHKLEFEHLENPDPEETALDKEFPKMPGAPREIIESLCSAIRNVTEMDICVGVLISNNSKHHVWNPIAPLTPGRVASLAELLSLPAPSMGERLKLGVRLASSVLQLHDTEWLQERWDKHDIYLIQADSSHSGSPSLETPVVRHTFTSEPPAPEVPSKSRILFSNLSLFSLGIILIELWFWRSVESFQVDELQVDELQVDPDIERYMTALQLITTMYGDAGMQYCNSVRRCI